MSRTRSRPTPGQQKFARRAAELGVRCWCFDADLTLTRGPAKTDAVVKVVRACLADSDAVYDAASPLLALLWPAGVVVVDLASSAMDRGQLVRVLQHFHADLSRAEHDAKAIDGFSQQLSQSYEEVNFVYRMAKLLTSPGDPARVVETICHELRGTLNYGWMAMSFGGGDGVLASLRQALLHAGPLPCDRTQFLTDFPATGDTMTGVLTPARHPLAKRSGSEVVAERVTHDEQPIGVLVAGNRQGTDPDISSGELQLIGAATNFLGLFHQNAFRFEQQRLQFIGTLHALSAAVDAKDPYTNGHSERVGQLAWQLATAIGYDAEAAEAVRVAGLLHDIGKIGVPEKVLCKTSRLTEEEFGLIKLHPQIGHDILKDLPSLAYHLPGVLYHHERWDGRGYPAKIAGAAIPMVARILAYADTFDAMSSSRSYRQKINRATVLAEIRKAAGTQLDPGLLEPFLSLDLTTFEVMLRAREAEAARAAAAMAVVVATSNAVAA